MNRVLRRGLMFLVALSLALTSVVAVSGRAYACSCEGITTPTAARRADVAFQGTVLQKTLVRKPAPGRMELRFQVRRVFRGVAFQEQVVASRLGVVDCGVNPEVGSSWVIFAVDRIEGSGDEAVVRYLTGLCSGNLRTEAAPPILGPGHPPLDGASDRGERAEATDAALTRALVVGAALAAGLAVVVLVGLGLIWRRR